MKEEELQLTGVLQKWGNSTKIEHWNSNQHLC